MYMYMENENTCMTCTQGCGNIEPTARHNDPYSPFLSCFPYTCTMYTVQFQLYLLDNVLQDWPFPHHCLYST